MSRNSTETVMYLVVAGDTLESILATNLQTEGRFSLAEGRKLILDANPGLMLPLVPDRYINIPVILLDGKSEASGFVFGPGKAALILGVLGVAAYWLWRDIK